MPENLLLEDLYNNVLTEFHAATVVLQRDGVSLGDARAVFDYSLSLERLAACNFGINHLMNSSRIAHSRSFESGVVKLCNGDVLELSLVEKAAVQSFILPEKFESNDEDLPLAMKVIKNGRKWQ